MIELACEVEHDACCLTTSLALERNLTLDLFTRFSMSYIFQETVTAHLATSWKLCLFLLPSVFFAEGENSRQLGNGRRTITPICHTWHFQHTRIR